MLMSYLHNKLDLMQVKLNLVTSGTILVKTVIKKSFSMLRSAL